MAIYPSEVGGCDFWNYGFRELIGEVGGEVVAVFAQGGEEFLTPRFAMLIGGFARVVGESVDFGLSMASNRLEAFSD